MDLEMEQIICRTKINKLSIIMIDTFDNLN